MLRETRASTLPRGREKQVIAGQGRHSEGRRWPVGRWVSLSACPLGFEPDEVFDSRMENHPRLGCIDGLERSLLRGVRSRRLAGFTPNVPASFATLPTAREVIQNVEF